jgi:hypothetical protein
MWIRRKRARQRAKVEFERLAHAWGGLSRKSGDAREEATANASSTLPSVFLLSLTVARILEGWQAAAKSPST